MVHEKNPEDASVYSSLSFEFDQGTIGDITQKMCQVVQKGKGEETLKHNMQTITNDIQTQIFLPVLPIWGGKPEYPWMIN